MKCPRCQSQNREGVRFCEECGGRLVTSCASCGAELLPDKKFCGSCGSPATPEPIERQPAPQGYTPKHLAEKILTSRHALEGERKQVTVLFADLKGSMELLADQDPEEARRLLDPVLERMMEAVHRYEGTVNQVMGDGIMALFGAPLAHEDHAVRACHAALRMQQTVGWYAEELRRGRGVDVQIRVGLNSGEVVVRAIDSDLHMDYSAIGQTTHLAARMEQLARPGSTLVSRETLRLAEGYIEVKPLGPVPVKGMPEPVEIFELVRTEQVHSRLEASAARGLTPFVGRESEVDALHQAMARASAGPRPDRRGVGRARSRQVAALLGVHPLPPGARLAHDGGAGHLLRQEHLVPHGEGAAPELLPARGAGRPAAGCARKSPASSSRSTRACAPPCPRSCSSSTCRWTTRSGRRPTCRSGGSGCSTRSSA